MSKIFKIIAVLLVCTLLFTMLTGCVTAKVPDNTEPSETRTVKPSPSPTPTPTEKPLSESEILQGKANDYLDALGCPSAGTSDNGIGLSITSIEKDGEEYKITWECSNPNAAGNEALIFTMMHFFDPDDFSNRYQAFTITPDNQIQYTFKAGDLISYNTFRINFAPTSKIVYLFFEGVSETSGAPAEFYTKPLFFTLILGDEPMVLESSPRLAGGIFDAYLTATTSTGGDTNLPLTLTAYDNTYVVDKAEAGFDENGNTTVTLTGSGFSVMPMRDGEFVIPVLCSITSGGSEYECTGASLSETQVIYSFDTSAVPDSIVIYPGDAPDNRTVVGLGD